MSWLRDVGGGISSITNQLTNFTKEVISEGREEVSDHVTELSISQQRARELEIQCINQKKEIDRLQSASKELEERTHAAELQIASTTREYRSLLKQKEDEIRKLEQQQELQDQLFAQSKNPNLASPGYQTSGSSCAAFDDMDEMEFADVISSQHEINRLSDTVHRLRAERDHWKRQATSFQGGEDGSTLLGNESIQQLEVKNKELERRLNETVDEHQRELSALQDAHEEKIAQIRRNLQSRLVDVEPQRTLEDASIAENEIRAAREKERTLQLLKCQLEKIQGEKHELEQSQVEVGILKETIAKLQKCEVDLKEQLKSARGTIQSHESLISQLKVNQDGEELHRKLEAAESKISELLHEREQASNSELLLEVQLARQKFTSKCDSKEMQLLKEKQDLANKMAAISAQSDDTQGSVSATEEEKEICSAQVKQLLDKLGDAEHQQLIAGIIHALELENDVLKEQNSVLQKQIINHDAKRVNKRANDSEQRSLGGLSPVNRNSRSASVERSEDGNQQYEFDELETSSMMSSYSELSQKNKELDEQLKTLQSQIETHERDIEHFEMVKSDWQLEKQSFGQLLEKMKNQLRAKESSFTVVTAQKGLLEVKKQSPRKARESPEEEEAGDLNLEFELEKLQEQIEELSQSSVHVENERDLLRIEKETILNELYKANKLTETLHEQLSKHKHNETDKLQKIIKELEENITSLTTDRDNLNTSLEELDKQHETAVEKILESRTEIQTKHKETQEELQIALSKIEEFQKQSEKTSEKLEKFDSIRNKLQTTEKELEESRKKEEETIKNILSLVKTDQEEIPEGNEISYATNRVEELRQRANRLEKELEDLRASKIETERALETLQHAKEEKTRSDWEVESWEDIADESGEKNGRENLIKSTKLQDLELESTSSKHSKDSSDDGQEKYGELVQRKEDLEIQVKELEEQVKELTERKTAVLDAEDEKRSLKMELEAALKEKSTVAELRNELEAMNNILKVYKENFDLDKMEDSAGKMEERLREKEKEVQKLKNELKSNKKEDIWWSEEEYRNLQREREQILSVLDEKSRENSSLKAEVHRLTSIVSAERSALDKAQQDTRQLLAEKEMGQAEASQMSNVAVQSLSRLVRDKELEIEALSQKNNTLVAILNESSAEGSQLELLLSERANLNKQIGVLVSEREQILTALRQKHDESVAYHAEIQRLSAALHNEHQKFTNLELQHSKVAKQYEDKQKSLINTQNEMICLKQRVTELEQQHLELKGKYLEMMQKEEAAETVQIARKEWNSREEELASLRKTSRDKDEWLFEKDKLLREHQQRIERVVEEGKRKDGDVVGLRRHVESLNVQIKSLRDELESNLKGEEANRVSVDNATSETNVLKETNSRLCLVVQEKEFEVNALKEKVLTLSRVVEQRGESDTSSSEEMKGLLIESEAMQMKAQEFQQERDQALIIVNQKQQENKQLNNQLQSLREREQKLHHELERLRLHLIQVEESYTQEAIHAEDREKELRNRLSQTEDRIRNAASSYTNASFQANVQVESLQQQLHVIAHQRDEALLKLDRAEDQIQQLAASLQTFQVVLEQFQQEKERDLAVLRNQHEDKIKQEQRLRQQLEYHIQALEHKLEEAKEALAAASRLSEILDQRNEDIASLKREVSDREGSLRKIQDEMRRVASSTEGKVDRSIIKNLLVNYLNIPPRQQPEVLKIIATVLDFDHEERVKAGLELSSTGGWMANWLGQKPAAITGAKQRSSSNPVPSLSAAFIQFLETESRPTFTMKLPAQSMVQEITRKTERTVVNPFASSPIPFKQGSATDSSHLLMKPMTATLPVFTPLPVSSSAPSFLRDVLKDE